MTSVGFQKGCTPWNKRGEPIEKTCPKCGKAFTVKACLDRVKTCSRSCAGKGRPSPMKGRTVSPETKAKQREAKLGIRGPDHWNWRGGLRSERKRAMARDEYQTWRRQVFERDNFTCQMCGDRGATLHADHIQPWAQHPELRFELSNGRALCVPCHWSTPSFPKKLIPRELRT